MRISSAVIAAGLVAGFCTAASAQTDGWYVGAEAGANFVPKIKFNATANTWAQQQDPGYAILGQVGYGFGKIRLEGEIGWRQNEINKYADDFGPASPSGNISGVSIMGNAYYDFVNSSKWTPYIGVGIGGIDVNFDNLKAGGLPVTNDGDFLFAYQGIAGVSYAVNDQLSVKADYRYLGTTDGNFSVASRLGGGSAQGSYASHSVLVGFTWKFGAPAPQQVAQQAAAAPAPAAPAPAPAPAPKPVQAAPIPKNFMIFFDFDKSDLTPEAKSILTQAVDAAKKQNATGFDLTGFTDTVGTAQYNQKLSERRAESAKKFLVSIGVPANEIHTSGKGKNDLLVPTKDGVREAQNRRVQIVLQ